MEGEGTGGQPGGERGRGHWFWYWGLAAASYEFSQRESGVQNSGGVSASQWRLERSVVNPTKMSLRSQWQFRCSEWPGLGCCSRVWQASSGLIQSGASFCLRQRHTSTMDEVLRATCAGIVQRHGAPPGRMNELSRSREPLLWTVVHTSMYCVPNGASQPDKWFS